jgi:hypothetical protein
VGEEGAVEAMGRASSGMGTPTSGTHPGPGP